MVPSGVTETIIDQLSGLLSAGDIVIDGGNSKFSDDGPRAEKLGALGIGYMDVGVSGGVWGITNGYALMVGGSAEHVAHAQPIFDALKPEGEFGFAHAGPVGAGHYSKMVHNGIEYGLMHAYAEGYELLKASELVTNVPEVFKSWREGSVVKSWLLDLLDRALDEDPELAGIKGYAEDTGEGRWTVEEGIRLGVPMNVIAASLFARFTSRQDDSPAIKPSPPCGTSSAVTPSSGRGPGSAGVCATIERHTPVGSAKDPGCMSVGSNSSTSARTSASASTSSPVAPSWSGRTVSERQT